MLALWLAGSLAVAATPTPEATVETVVTHIRSFEHAPEDAGLTTEQKAHNQELSKQLQASLDIHGLAERVLSDQWKQLSAAEKKRFATLLSELFAQVAFPNAAKFFGDLSVNIDPQPKTDVYVLGPPQSTVIGASLSHPDEGLVDIDFAVAKVHGEWKVVDIVLDGVSLGLDIRAQMQKILDEKGYPELKRRMREKLQEET